MLGFYTRAVIFAVQRSLWLSRVLELQYWGMLIEPTKHSGGSSRHMDGVRGTEHASGTLKPGRNNKGDPHGVARVCVYSSSVPLALGFGNHPRCPVMSRLLGTPSTWAITAVGQTTHNALYGRRMIMERIDQRFNYEARARSSADNTH